MGYFKDIEEKKKIYADHEMPMAYLGEKEVTVSSALETDFYDVLTGKLIGRAHEEISAKNGKTITRLVLSNGETAATAVEWETEEEGRKVSHAEVTFSRKCAMGNPEKSIPDYVIRKEHNMFGQVSVLVENDHRREIRHYNDSRINPDKIAKVALWRTGALRKVTLKDGTEIMPYVGDGRIRQITDFYPSTDSISEKYQLRDRDISKFDKLGRLVSSERVTYKKGYLKDTVRRSHTKTDYKYDSSTEKIKSKNMAKRESEIRFSDSPSEKKLFDGELMPRAFAESEYSEMIVMLRDGRKMTEISKEGTGRGYFHEVKRQYYDNGKIENEMTRTADRTKRYTKTTSNEYSKSGKPIKEYLYLLQDVSRTETFVHAETREYKNGVLTREISKEMTKTLPPKGLRGLIGHAKKEVEEMEVKYTVDPQGKTREEVKRAVTITVSDSSVRTEFVDKEKTRQVTTITDPDSDTKFKIEKIYSDGKLSERTVTANGKDVTEDYPAEAEFVSKSSQGLTLSDLYDGRAKRFSMITKTVRYDDDGKVCSAEETRYDHDGHISESASYTGVNGGIVAVEKDENGDVCETAFYSDNGEHRSEYLLYETKHARIFITEGCADIGPISTFFQNHDPNKEFPITIMYTHGGPITVDVMDGCGISAADITKNLWWGRDASADGSRMCSPSFVCISETDIIRTAEAAETVIEPIDTVSRLREVEMIKTDMSKALREKSIDREPRSSAINIE